jgi:hypothetical protein
MSHTKGKQHNILMLHYDIAFKSKVTRTANAYLFLLVPFSLDFMKGICECKREKNYKHKDKISFSTHLNRKQQLPVKPTVWHMSTKAT